MRPTLCAGAVSLVVLAGCGADGGGGRSESAVSRSELAGLRSAPCPEPIGKDRELDPSRLPQGMSGRFKVAGREVRAEVPIDWERDPFASENWRQRFVMLTWLEPLYAAYAREGDVRALERALAVALDFARQHARAPARPDLIWERKRTGIRAEVLAYLARAGACEGVLARRSATRLLDSAREHGRFLERSEAGVENHSLVAAMGLVKLADVLPFLRQAREWRERGLDRSLRIVRGLVDAGTGAHLEHSPGYQDQTAGYVAELAELARGERPGLDRLAGRMRDVASWFVMPDRTLVPLGDTPSIDRPPPYASNPDAKRGLSPLRPVGYAFVKEEGSYLGVAAGYHTVAHKHADELTFNLFEDGRRVIVDSGRRNKARDDDDPASQVTEEFTLSSQAASTLTIDGRSFAVGEPYGSAIDAQGRDPASGWYAVQGHNPLLQAQGVRHRRLFLYRPGAALVVLDKVRSADPRLIERWLQVAPRIELDAGRRTARLSAPGFAATVWNAPSPGELAPAAYRGQERPLRGWWVPPGYAPLRPRWTLALRSRESEVDHVTTIALGPRPARARLLSDGRNTRVRVALPGERPVVLHARRRGHRIDLATEG